MIHTCLIPPPASTVLNPTLVEFPVLIQAVLNSDLQYTMEKPKPLIPEYFMEAMWKLHRQGSYITNYRLMEMLDRGDTYTRGITHRSVELGLIEKTEDSMRGHTTKFFLTQYGKNYIKNYLGV